MGEGEKEEEEERKVVEGGSRRSHERRKGGRPILFVVFHSFASGWSLEHSAQRGSL